MQLAVPLDSICPESDFVADTSAVLQRLGVGRVTCAEPINGRPMVLLARQQIDRLVEYRRAKLARAYQKGGQA